MIGLKQYIIENLQNGYFDSNTKSRLFLILSIAKTTDFDKWLHIKKIISVCVGVCDKELQKSIIDANGGEPFPMGLTPQSIKQNESYKVATTNFEFVDNIEKEFNSLDSSKKFSKEYQKSFDRVKRQEIIQDIKNIVSKTTSKTLNDFIKKEGY